MERSILEEVPRQLNSLPDRAILEIHVSDSAGAAAIRKLLDGPDFDGVEVIYTPKAP